MKVHKPTFAEINQPGSIWPAVSIAKQEHRRMLFHKRNNQWNLQDHCRMQRDTIMHTVNLIARGLMANVDRHNRRSAAITITALTHEYKRIEAISNQIDDILATSGKEAQ